MSYDLSIVIPAYNEEASLPELFAALNRFVPTVDFSLQLVFVDDGSSDATAEMITDASIPGANIKLVKLSRNFGAHEAIRAGFFAADAERIVLFSVDMPEPVEDIARFFELLEEGNELVYSERLNYRGSLGSRLFGKVVKHIVHIDFPDQGLIGVGFGGKIKREMNRNIESSSSVFYQIFMLGFKRTSFPVSFNERLHGTSKWTFRKKVRHLLDVFVMFSYTPIHAISILGFLLFAVGLLWALAILIIKLTVPDAVAAGWPTTISILLVGFGVTNLSLGILSEYVARTLVAARNRPTFVIDEIVEAETKIAPH